MLYLVTRKTTLWGPEPAVVAACVWGVGGGQKLNLRQLGDIV